MTTFEFARIHNDVGGDFRVLADRLWPRGISKERAHLSLWAKEITPSHELRQWFHHTADFAEFEQRYRAELASNADLAPFVRECARHPVVTLLTAAKDPAHSHVTVLAAMVQAQMDTF